MNTLGRFLTITSLLLLGNQLQGQVTNFALQLNGSDRVACGRLSELTGKDSYAVQFLIAPESWSGNAYIFKQGTGNSEFSARLSAVPGEVLFKVGAQEIKAIGVATQGWTQLSLAVFPNGADVWVNGAKTWHANSNLSISASDADLTLGEGFSGRLDEFRIWNTEMPSEKSSNLMFQNTVNKFHPQWDNLVLYYKFDQDQCVNHIVDYKLSHHASMTHAIQRVPVSDNAYFRYRVVSGYSDYNRHCDRLQIDRDMHLMTNDLIMLISHVDGSTGKLNMANTDDATFTGGTSYVANHDGRDGILKLDGTGTMNLGKNTIRAGAPAMTTPTFEGWFNISTWVEGACLLRKEESDKKYMKIYLGSYANKELIVEANGWKKVYTDQIDDIRKWQHLAVVFDPTTRSKLSLYVNNALANGTLTKPADQTTYDVMDIDADALIGENFVGMMDEIMIWRNARNAFAGDMEGTSIDLKFPGGGYGSIFLDAYWKFDTDEKLGHNLRSWQGVLRNVKEQYSGYRGFKVRVGMGATAGWQDNIGRKEWRDNLAAGVARIAPHCDGFDVDFEWLDNNVNNSKWVSYGEMVKALRAVIPSPKILSVSLHPVSYTLPRTDEVLNAIDYITFQNYGPRHSSLLWNAYSAFWNTALNYGLPAEKIHLSMATTIVRTDNSGLAVLGYVSLENDPNLTAESNEMIVNGQSYTFNGVNEVKKKMKLLVDNNSGGCMYFDMGNDLSAQHELSLVRSLNSVISSNVDLLITDVNNIPGTSIEEVEFDEEKVSVSPNPANDFVTVTGFFDGEVANYELYAISGVKLLSEKSADDEVVLPLQGLCQGTYLLHIKDSKKTAVKKIQVK